MTDPEIVSTRSMDDNLVVSILASASDLDILSDLSSKSDPEESGTIHMQSPKPRYLPVRQPELCWRCGKSGHKRFFCRDEPILFCSRCGLSGVMSRDCVCLDARQVINRRKILKKRPRKRIHLRGVTKRTETLCRTESRDETQDTARSKKIGRHPGKNYFR